MTPSRRTRASVAAMGIACSIAPSAWGYRTLEDYSDVPDGARVGWPGGVFEYWTHEGGTDSVSAEALAETSLEAFAGWRAARCGQIAPSHLGITPFRAEPDDGQNTIEIVREDWESLGFPADAAGANDILFGELDDGSWAILEADIYINAEHHRFSTANEPEGDERSLLGVLTHEGGHALGLLHPCEPDGVDEAPECGPEDAPSDLMSPYYAADQLYPTEEDLEAVCYLYPSCDTDDDCDAGFRCERAACTPVEDDGDGGAGSGEPGSGGQGGGGCENRPPEKLPTGEECSESNQCEGGECVAGVEDVPICSQRCGSGEPSCPSRWTCADVEDRKVCIPPNPDSGCECALVAPDRSSRGANSVAGLVAVGIGLVWVRRVRRRSSFNPTRAKRSRVTEVWS